MARIRTSEKKWDTPRPEGIAEITFILMHRHGVGTGYDAMAWPGTLLVEYIGVYRMRHRGAVAEEDHERTAAAMHAI